MVVIPNHVYWFLFLTHPCKTLINLRSYLLYLISLVTQLVYYTVGKWESVGVLTTEYNILVEKLGSSQWAVLNTANSFGIHFMPFSPKWHLPVTFPTEIIYATPIFPMRATCPAFIVLIDFGVWWRPQIITIPIAVHLLPSLSPTVILSTLFSPLICLLPLLEKQFHIHKN